MKIACRKMVIVAFVIALLLVIFSFFPRYGQFYGSVSVKQQQKIDLYLEKYNGGGRDVGKETPVFDDVYANLSYSTPHLARVAAYSKLGVYGTIIDAEYACQTKDLEGKERLVASKKRDELPGVAHWVQYTLQVKESFIGKLWYKQKIKILVTGNSTEGINAQLGVGDETIFLLQGFDAGLKENYYTPTLYEHGCFKVNNTDVYAFSNILSTCNYDGASTKKLIKDIKRMRQEMGLC